MKNKIQLNITIISVIVIFLLTGLVLLETIEVLIAIFLGLLFVALTIALYLQSNPKVENNIKTDDEYTLDFESSKKDIPAKKREMKTCPVCQTENIVNGKYCKKCNTNIQNITCPVCDTKNPFTNKYCSNCDSILQNKRRH